MERASKIFLSLFLILMTSTFVIAQSDDDDFLSLLTAIIESSSPGNDDSTNDDDSNTNDTVDSLGLTDINLRDESATLVADFYAPASMVDRLAENRTVTWSQLANSPENLTRIAFGESGSNDVFVVNDDNDSISSSFAVEASLILNAQVDNDLLLRAIFQFVEVESGKFALFSTKHGNYALDASDDETSVILRDVRSLAAYDAESASFLTFAANTSPSALVANGRYVINASDSSANNTLAFDAVGNWENKEVVLNNGNLELAASGGTLMSFYVSPVNLDIPGDFNPDGTERVSNAEFYSTSAAEGDLFANGIDGLNDIYSEQVAAQGSNAATLAAVESKLDEIETALASQNSQMRYPREFYLAFREALFNRRVHSSESADASIGALTVPYVYFTNETDENDDYHPFMVIATHDIPDTLALLGDVPRPPGDGLAGDYTTQNVTRSFYMENFLLQIPLRDYGEVSSVDENDLSAIGSLADDVGESDYDHHNYASTGQSAVAIDGVVIYPSFNNRLVFAQQDAELSARGMHSGRGLGVHYHADPHSAALTSSTNDTGFNLYNESDYTGNHPPVISIGFDGIAGYGFYLNGDTSSDGVNIALDEFGGHEHEDYGYHYHAHTTDRTTTINLNDYTTHELGPLGAWAGRINYIPSFQQGGNRNIWLGNPD